MDWTFSDGTTVAQGSGGAKTATGNVTVTVANAAPVVTNIGGSSVSGTPTSAISIDAGADAAVTDADSTHFNGGNITLTKVGTLSATAAFTVDGTNVTSSSGGGVLAAGDTISVGGTAIGTVDNTDTGQTGNSLKINFNTNDATPARISTLIQNLKFQAGADGASVFDITVTDAAGGTTSTAARVTINATTPPAETTNNNLNVSQIAPTPTSGDGGDGGGTDPIGETNIGGGDVTGTSQTQTDAGTTVVGADSGTTLGGTNADAGFTFGGTGGVPDPGAPATDALVQNAVSGNDSSLSSFYGSGSVTTGGRGTGADAANAPTAGTGQGLGLGRSGGLVRAPIDGVVKDVSAGPKAQG